MHSRRLNQLAHCLQDSAVIAYPSETLWGLGCLANKPLALQRLVDIKQRDAAKGFIIISPNIDLCLPYIDVSYHDLAQQKIVLNKQQPTTWITPKSPQVSSLLSGCHHSIAVRISPHPFIADICALTQQPLVSTSANLSKHVALNSALLITKQFRKSLDSIVRGYDNGAGKSSQIIDLISNKRLR